MQGVYYAFVKTSIKVTDTITRHENRKKNIQCLNMTYIKENTRFNCQQYNPLKKNSSGP